MTRKRVITQELALPVIVEFLRDLATENRLVDRDTIRQFLHDWFAHKWGTLENGEIVPAEVKYPPRSTAYDWLEVLLKRFEVFRVPAPSNGKRGRDRVLWGWLDA